MLEGALLMVVSAEANSFGNRPTNAPGRPVHMTIDGAARAVAVERVTRAVSDDRVGAHHRIRTHRGTVMMYTRLEDRVRVAGLDHPPCLRSKADGGADGGEDAD